MPAKCFHKPHRGSEGGGVMPDSHRAHVTRWTPIKAAAASCVRPTDSRADLISCGLGGFIWGLLKRIHVNQHVIRSNKRHGSSEPPICIRTSKGVQYCSHVRIDGPSELVYSPDKPLSCGARLWIETRAEVVSD